MLNVRCIFDFQTEVEVIDADEAPSFPHVLPEKLTPHENDEHVHLECQVRGEPIPKIVWLVMRVVALYTTQMYFYIIYIGERLSIVCHIYLQALRHINKYL